MNFVTAKKFFFPVLIAFTGLVVALTLFLVFTKPAGKVTAPRPPYDRAQFRAEILQLQREHEQRIRAIYEKFKHEIAAAGEEDFLLAESRIDSVVDHFSSVSTTLHLLSLMACDLVQENDRTQRYIFTHLEPVSLPCAAGVEAVQTRGRLFMHHIQSETNIFHAELGSRLRQLSEVPPSRDFIEHLQRCVLHPGSLGTLRYGLALTGGVAELFFLRQTLASLRNLLGHIAVKSAGSTAAILADGPLPIGDLFAAAGFVWSIADLCHVTVQMPINMRTTLTASVAHCRNSSRAEALKLASEAVKNSLELVAGSVRSNLE